MSRFTPHRGPIDSNPDCGLLPSPYEYIVPKASPLSWIKGVVGLAVIVGLFWMGLVLS